jgi:hypothetical protein
LFFEIGAHGLFVDTYLADVAIEFLAALFALKVDDHIIPVSSSSFSPTFKITGAPLAAGPVDCRVGQLMDHEVFPQAVEIVYGLASPQNNEAVKHNDPCYGKACSEVYFPASATVVFGKL